VSSPTKRATARATSPRSPVASAVAWARSACSPPSPSGSRPRSACCTTRRSSRSVAFPPRLVPAVGTVAALASGVALAAVGLSTERPVVRVGLLFAGVFGVLATVSGAATVAAAVAIPVGAALAFARAMGPPETYFELRRGVIALTFALAVGLSLAATAGLVGSPSERPDPPRSSRGDPPRGSGRGRPGRPRCRRTRVRGVVAASAAAPYVTGSALLAGFAVVGSPHLLVATAAFGGVAAAVSGFRGGDARLAIGAVLLLLAGVPATPGPRPPSVSARRSRCSTRTSSSGRRTGRTNRTLPR